MKRFISVIFCFIMLFSFASCKKESEQPVAKKQDFVVEFEFNEEKSTGAKVCMMTSLPIGTLLDVDIFIGDKFHSTETVEVQADATGNFFVTESQKDADEKEIPDGNYILSFQLAQMSLQPSSVTELIGENGELMQGNEVYENTESEGKTIKFTRPIVKLNGNFTMPDGTEE